MIVVLVIAATRRCHSFAMGVSGSAALGRWLVVFFLRGPCAGTDDVDGADDVADDCGQRPC